MYRLFTTNTKMPDSMCLVSNRFAKLPAMGNSTNSKLIFSNSVS